MAKPKIQFRIRHFGDLRDQSQRDSWEKIWKGWKGRQIPWRSPKLVSIDCESLEVGAKGTLKILLSR